MKPCDFLRASTRLSSMHGRPVARLSLWSALICATAATPTRAEFTQLEHVATGAHAPTSITHAPGDPNRLFVLSKLGEIKILNLTTGAFEATPFLTVPDVDYIGESGLVGMAFHPDYQSNGKFYVYTTFDNGGILIDGIPSPLSSQVREYTVSSNPNVANAAYKPVLDIVRPHVNHIAGWIDFSPVDGYLYVASGDGGHGNDDGPGHTPGIGNAQDLTNNLMGKMLRIDVDGDDFPNDHWRNYAIPSNNPFADKIDPATGVKTVVEGDDEIWAYGLRNPYRASFDRVTGDLWISDVGQGSREEINFQSARSRGGENYGWRVREGSIATPGISDPIPAHLVDPVYDYTHANVETGGKAVIGGFVYRGPDPELQGKYIFADAETGKYWMLDPADIPTSPEDPPLTATLLNTALEPEGGFSPYPSSFGEDAYGNLYVSYYFTHNVYRMTTDALTPGDFNGNSRVGGRDLEHWEEGYGMHGDATHEHGDADGDGTVDGTDFLRWQRNLGWSPYNAPEWPLPVPEPASAALTFIALAPLIKRRSRGNI